MFKAFSNCTTKARYTLYGITDFEYRSVRRSDKKMRVTENFGGENGVFASKTCEENLRRVVHGLHELS